MKKSIWSVAAIITSVIFIYSCKKSESVPNERVPNLPTKPYNYLQNDLPAHLMVNGELTDEGATLGRVLFFDKKLSYNDKVACASCHLPEHGFSDNVEFSKGLNGEFTTRNAMSLLNMGNTNTFFWDCRAGVLEEAVLMPIQNHIEMGIENLSLLEAKLNKVDYYKKLFSLVFKKERVTKEDISRALSQFIRAINTRNSKLDLAIMNGFTSFTAEEQRGKELFDKNQCSSCHLNVTNMDFSAGYEGPAGSGFANNGLDEIYIDKGVEQSKMKISDGEGFFKVPNLRNVELTAPYMHDGRFKTLEEVVEHYNSKIKMNKDLDPHLIKKDMGIPTAVRMNMSPSDKAALIAFLKTMTDHTISIDPKFSDPFNY